MAAERKPALFLDRDGVINVNRGFVSRCEDFEWMPGIFDVARTAVGRGMPIVVVTNQTGIGCGYYSEDDFADVTRFMRKRFDDEGAPLAATYHCPFHPDAIEERYRAADHPWRKPNPGMILAARDDLYLDLARSALLGDRAVDLQAGQAAGVGALGLIGDADMTAAGVLRFHRFADLGPVPAWLDRLGNQERLQSGSCTT